MCRAGRACGKGFGVVLLIGGLALMLGMLAGSRDLLQPLGIFKGGAGGTAQAAEAHGLAFDRVKDVAALDARLAQAKADGRAVMLDFYADWCVSCKEMERFTFSDPKVQARLKDVVLLQADVTANSDADKALLKRFRLFGPPGLIFWTPDGDAVGLPGDRFRESREVSGQHRRRAGQVSACFRAGAAAPRWRRSEG